MKKVFLKVSQYSHRKTIFAIFTQENTCARVTFLLKLQASGKIFKNTFFTEHLWMTASILQELLTLYFSIVYTWQISSNEKSLVGKKFIHISQEFYRFLLRRYFFLIFFEKCIFTLSATQNLCCTLSSQPFCQLGDT